MEQLQLATLLIIGVFGLYALSCIYSGGIKKVHLKLALYYVGVMAILGVIGELIVDSLYKLFAGTPLWVYQVSPLHGGYTSVFSIFIWGAMGFQIYLVHDTLSGSKLPSLYKLAILFAVEAVILEVLFDLISRVFLGRYVYYYLPKNLGHVTSFQVMPLYLITGYFYLYILTRFRPKNYQTSTDYHATE